MWKSVSAKIANVKFIELNKFYNKFLSQNNVRLKLMCVFIIYTKNATHKPIRVCKKFAKPTYLGKKY